MLSRWKAPHHLEYHPFFSVSRCGCEAINLRSKREVQCTGNLSRQGNAEQCVPVESWHEEENHQQKCGCRSHGHQFASKAPRQLGKFGYEDWQIFKFIIKEIQVIVSSNWNASLAYIIENKKKPGISLPIYGIGALLRIGRLDKGNFNRRFDRLVTNPASRIILRCKIHKDTRQN